VFHAAVRDRHAEIQAVELDDAYSREEGHVFLTGMQALG
jgi:hypothetical protein